MSEKREVFEGYQPTLKGLKDKNGNPITSLDPKKLKPPKGDSAIEPPKVAPGDRPSQT